MATSIPVIHSNVGDSYTTPVDATDRLDQFFADAQLQRVDSGHFVPLERPHQFAAAVAAATSTPSA